MKKLLLLVALLPFYSNAGTNATLDNGDANSALYQNMQRMAQYDNTAQDISAGKFNMPKTAEENAYQTEKPSANTQQQAALKQAQQHPVSQPSEQRYSHQVQEPTLQSTSTTASVTNHASTSNDGAYQSILLLIQNTQLTESQKINLIKAISH
ncbi:hypothetical protein L0B53_13645 [Vibrio sp. SS-MA-C1-2]|uniref:hypothetical protein n=1 Tax=Vibrio sp. SS-MA-C1-2 TaxID=2908646 RepID=UPI001F2A5D9B|nr:hypothetical protein [Vibrio sp. SS-MA-C1-2]UJF18060.1 hypothetical protein L0B53_13645 [Vibrio sp. SS-MA-C1-2]